MKHAHRHAHALECICVAMRVFPVHWDASHRLRRPPVQMADEWCHRFQLRSFSHYRRCRHLLQWCCQVSVQYCTVPGIIPVVWPLPILWGEDIPSMSSPHTSIQDSKETWQQPCKRCRQRRQCEKDQANLFPRPTRTPRTVFPQRSLF